MVASVACRAATGLLLALALATTAWAAPPAAYRDTSLSFAQRAADLVSRMTLEEKVAQMQNDAPAIPRLGVPAYNWWSEALHGSARAGAATVFPIPIGMAATFDPALQQTVAAAISDEARAKYDRFQQQGRHGRYQGLTLWAPVINIDRDPRWGRGMETFGEDPYLTSEMGVAFVRGLQGNDPKYRKTDATAKHFVAYSGPEAGRHRLVEHVDARDLHDTYLPAFQALVQQGDVAAVMAAYSSVNGTPSTANRPLLQGILRSDWGFKGYVVSDCDAVGDIYQTRHLVADAAQASAMAVDAGTDLDCGNTYAALVQAVKDGKVSVHTIDAAVTRLMQARFRLGMFDPAADVPWSKLPYSVLQSPEFDALALRAAQESVVLLKNDGVLPLASDVKRIAVVGPTADSVAALLGDYHGAPKAPVTILQGIRQAVPDAQVTYVQGAELVQGLEAWPDGTVIAPGYLRPVAGSGEHGLTAQYFHNGSFTDPVLTRTDPRVDFDWIHRGPTFEAIANGKLPEDRALDAFHFAARWTGELVPPVSGTYEFGAPAASGFRLYLDGHLLLDRDGAGSKGRARDASVKLEAGHAYAIRLDYVRGADNADVRLAWRMPGTPPPFEAALAAARKADVTVFVGGLTPDLEGEEMSIHYPGFSGGDRTRLRLPATQAKLLRALQATGKPLVLVLTGGSALAVDWANQHLPAILMAWYPGQRGGTAVADVLFGRIDPSGRLPVTFYRNVGQLPPFDDYAMAGRTYRYFKGRPLYPFGYGLSYTRFAYADLKLDRTTLAPDGHLRVTLTVKNTGKRAGDAVVQLYLHALRSSRVREIKSLHGIRRVALRPGEQRTVSFDLVPQRDLRHYDVARRAYTVYPGRYQVQVGASSDDIRATRDFTVQ